MALERLQIQYIIRLKTAIFPLALHELLTSLQKKGYELNPTIPMPLPTGRVDVGGPVARKGRTVVIVDSGTQHVGTIGESIESTIESFRELENQLLEDHRIKLGDFARFWAFTAFYLFTTKRKAYESVSNAFKLSRQEELSEVIGQPVSLFEFRIGGANLKVNDDNWFDIRISPNVPRDDSYHIDVAFRNTDRRQTEAFMGAIESKLAKIIELIEG